MSQAKVDKYKKEKKNRAKMLKRKKIRKVITVFVLALAIGGVLGATIGRRYYDYVTERERANRTVSALYFDDWFNNYYNANYSTLVSFDTSSDSEGASVSDASASDAESDTDVSDSE